MYFVECPSSSMFPEYRETYSSSSSSMTSASSLRTSTGKVHKPATMSMNLLPMTIIRSDDSCRRKSINMHPDTSLSSSFAQNEV